VRVLCAPLVVALLGLPVVLPVESSAQQRGCGLIAFVKGDAAYPSHAFDPGDGSLREISPWDPNIGNLVSVRPRGQRDRRWFPNERFGSGGFSFGLAFSPDGSAWADFSSFGVRGYGLGTYKSDKSSNWPWMSGWLDSDRLLLQGDGLEVLTVKTGERSQIQAGVESGVIYDVQWATFDNKRTALIAEHDKVNESAGLFLDAKTLGVSQAFPDGRVAVQTRFVGNRLVRTVRQKGYSLLQTRVGSLCVSVG
jgi:hypothetical protein